MIAPVSTAPIVPRIQISVKSLVLFYMFLGLPLFDMINGFLIGQGYLEPGSLASPSQIGRFMGIVLLLAATIRLRYSRYIIFLLIAAGLLETLFFFRHNNLTGVIIGYVYVSRFFYMYLAYLFLTRFFEGGIDLLLRFLKYNIVFICASVIFASFTGLANSTYGWGEGTKGFFASGNGLGIYIGVATLVLAAMKKYRVYDQVSIAVFGLSAYTLTLLGTKTSFIMFLLVVFAGFWSGRLRFLFVPAIVLGAVQFFSQISARLVIQYDIILQRYENSRSLRDYLLSNRNVYAETAWAEFGAQEPGLLRWLFGGGAFLSFQDPQWVRTFDTLETDVFDVLFMYGLLGLICYGLIMVYSVRHFARNAWMLLPIVLLWGHSVIAGHVLFNGLGATLMVLMLAIGVGLNSGREFESPTALVSARRHDGSQS